MILEPFEPVQLAFEPKFPRIRNIVRYLWVATITGVAYGVLTFGIVAGFKLAKLAF